jgi:hypothetical protein
LVGALVGMGLPEYEAKRYEGHVKNALRCRGADRAGEGLLKGTGAIDVAAASRPRRAGSRSFIASPNSASP